MKKPACRRTVALLVMSSLLWTATAQAFFCFSMGGGSRNRGAQYRPPPPYGAFGAAGLPVLRFASPALPQAPITPVAPVETPNVDYPAAPVPVPKQHIFH
jgi:hypothetical protein